MRQFGKVEISQGVFLAALKMDAGEAEIMQRWARQELGGMKRVAYDARPSPLHH